MIWIVIMIAVVYFLIKSAVKNGIIEAHNYIKEKDDSEKDKEGGRHW
jgi:cbb3-type cytochrome oxidase subunit 3